MKTRSPLLVLVLCAAGLGGVSACSHAPESQNPDSAAQSTDPLSTSEVSALALANVGKGACSSNSRGGHAFDTSCTGNDGEPEYWCADFARWVWASAGAEDTDQLSAAAGSFYVYGQNHGTLSDTPTVGAAVVFNYHGGGSADHVAIVTQVNGDGTIETVSGDWNGESGSESHFSSTSHVVHNTPAYGHDVGTAPGIMGMTISGYITAVGLAKAPPPPPPSCSVKGVAGVCIDTSACAAKGGGHHSTPGLCPGPADEQCCTP
jgi:hypothetical protein